MLSYAFQTLNQEQYEDVATESFDEMYDLLAAIRSEAIQLSHQEFQHSNSASTPDVASAAVLRG